MLLMLPTLADVAINVVIEIINPTIGVVGQQASNPSAAASIAGQQASNPSAADIVGQQALNLCAGTVWGRVGEGLLISFKILLSR